MTTRNVVAVDMGAESGRVLLGRYDGRRVEVEDVHRFPNGPREIAGALRWDVNRLWREVREGLAKVGTRTSRVDSVGVDTWGIDYGYLDHLGRLIDDPIAHRDTRTRGMLAEACRLVGRDRLYRETGSQLMEVNAVYQLLAEARTPRPRFRDAHRLLMVPDLFHHLLAGSAVAEFTAVSTSGAYDVTRREWAASLLRDLGVPDAMLPEVVDAGTDLGPLLPEIAGDSPGLRSTRVIAPGSHDTASAVVGTPLAEPGAAYVSSGTWSLVGVEASAPVVTAETQAANLTNEGGVLGTTRLLRNCMGLWLLQECRRQWAREGRRYDYGDLVELAARQPAGHSVVNPDHRDFVPPGDMPSRIRDYCARTGQRVPDSPGAVTRCVLDSLALRYRMTFEDLGAATGRPVPAVHIVGGGARNALLNTLTADVSGLPVLTGPFEATALGNVMVQLVALGELKGLSDARDMVRTGQRPESLEPSGAGAWDELYEQFRGWVAADLAEAGITD